MEAVKMLASVFDQTLVQGEDQMHRPCVRSCMTYADAGGVARAERTEPSTVSGPIEADVSGHEKGARGALWK